MTETKPPLFVGSDYRNPMEQYPETTLGKMANVFLSQQNHNQSLKKSKAKAGEIKFYPSSTGQCARKNVYQMLGYAGSPQRGESLMIMQNGTSFHERMEKIFEDMGILIAPELSLKDPELHISGRSDAIIWSFLKQPDEPDGAFISLQNLQGEVVYEGPENYIMLVEFKSIKDSKFQKLTNAHAENNHIRQLQLYFHLTGITKGLIYYENKNTQMTKEYIVERDEAIIADVLKEIRNLVAYAKQKTLPPRGHDLPTDMPCRWCQYRDLCWVNPNPFSFEDLFKTDEELRDAALPF